MTTFKRMRSSMATTAAVVVAAALVGVAAGEAEVDVAVAGGGESDMNNESSSSSSSSSLRHTAELELDYHHQEADKEHEHEMMGEDQHEFGGEDHQEDQQHQLHHQHSQEFRRRLAQSAAETFASYTPEKVQRALPLDLKIDDHGKPFVAGLNGYLEPYETTFSEGHSSSSYWDSIVDLNEIVEDADYDSHVVLPHNEHPNRLYYKILEEDGIGEVDVKKGLRGRRNKGQDRRLEVVDSSSVHLDSIVFRPVSEVQDYFVDGEDEEEEEEEGYYNSSEEEVEAEAEEMSAERGRALRDSKIFSSAPSTSTNTKNMKVRGNNNGGRNKNKNKNKNNQNKAKKKLPKIDRLTPSKNDVVRGKQTFSARIVPSATTNSPIDSVQFQLKDHTDSSSDWLKMDKVGDAMYEITVDGFGQYPGTKWEYDVQAKDENGKRKRVDGNTFQVGGDNGGSNAGNFANNNNGKDESISKAPGAPAAKPLPKSFVKDGDWTNGGSIQASTGRVMFEFDDARAGQQTFVCSGTVICDGSRGKSPDTRNGRSIIQTAAHCAYNDILKKFASKAIFIPDQVSTRGSKSDFDCNNDRYGCWHLSFAVVAEGWSSGSFPDNVPYDYAYYTVYDDQSAHSGGYQKGLTGTLDVDVPCVPVDFDADPRSEFVFSIGYSADRDPDLRHCSMESTVINGVAWYTNAWLDDCAMTGGASGGPWIREMDEDGIGTLMGVNSWGFTHKPGMASPDLRTSTGSMAECLFDKARRANDPGWTGGIIVDNC